MNVISVREFSLLSVSDDKIPTPTNIYNIPQSAFDWLKKQILQQPQGQARFMTLRAKFGVECLQVTNYVGVLETPCGTCIEILPKIMDTTSDHILQKQEVAEARCILWKMLAVVFKLPRLEISYATLQTKNRPLIEILISCFLQHASRLLHRGLRSDYQRMNGQTPFLKGRFNIAKQLRQPVTKQHYFCIEYDAFCTNRAENRLLKTALYQVLNSSRAADHQRLARELLFLLDVVPYSTNITLDMSQWREQRDMVHYQAVKPWVHLLLMHQSPWFLAGSWRGVSMLFAMERLFERYVAHQLRKRLVTGLHIVEQASKYHLLQHKGKKIFTLKPDISIRQGDKTLTILDTKWKRLTASERVRNYGLSQADMYQLFAYGQTYLQGKGELYLVFPRQSSLQHALPVFDFGSGLSLWVVPFDLRTGTLIQHVDLDHTESQLSQCLAHLQ